MIYESRGMSDGRPILIESVAGIVVFTHTQTSTYMLPPLAATCTAFALLHLWLLTLRPLRMLSLLYSSSDKGRHKHEERVRFQYLGCPKITTLGHARMLSQMRKICARATQETKRKGQKGVDTEGR